MKGIQANMIVSLIVLAVVSVILFSILTKFFIVVPAIGYDSQTKPSLLHQGESRDFCFDSVNLFVDSCVLNDTAILREEGYFESIQLSKYKCKYNLIHKTGFNMTIYCRMGKKCYIDKSEKYDIGKCK